ncbi:unnamed protein product, partial [Prorocentrum cordatum]
GGGGREGDGDGEDDENGPAREVCSDEGLASRASVVILGPTLSVSPQGVGVGRLRSGTAGRPPAFPRSSAGVRVKRQDDLAGVHAAHLQLKNAFDDVEEKLGPAAGSADPPGSPQLEERPETSVSEGATYAGQWKGSLRHGQGVLKGADGQRYHGSFRNGQVHGHGVFKAASGNTYEGQWELSKRHGRGKYVHMDRRHHLRGRVEAGHEVGLRGGAVFRQRQVRGAVRLRLQARRRDLHLGPRRDVPGAVQGGQDGRTGHLRVRGRKDEVRGTVERRPHEGVWQDDVAQRLDVQGAVRDLKHGDGVFSWPDGRSYSGTWKEGNVVGAGVIVDANGVHVPVNNSESGEIQLNS